WFCVYSSHPLISSLRLYTSPLFPYTTLFRSSPTSRTGGGTTVPSGKPSVTRWPRRSPASKPSPPRRSRRAIRSCALIASVPPSRRPPPTPPRRPPDDRHRPPDRHRHRQRPAAASGRDDPAGVRARPLRDL